MTSWTKRIQNCSYVINSILKNTVKPDTIFLNLSVEEFPNKWNDLPYELIDLSQKNPIFKINWVDGTNTKSMKKVFPILQYIEDDDIIIIVDDDLDIPINFIQIRLTEFREHWFRFPISGGTNPKYHLNLPLYNTRYNSLTPTSIFTKKMLCGYEKLWCNELVNTYNDDTIHTMLCLSNGYYPIPSKYLSTFCGITKNKVMLYKDNDGMKNNKVWKSDKDTIGVFSNRFNQVMPYTFKQSLLNLVIFDSFDVAGDNGEAFYRYVRKTHPEIKLTFLLSKNCKDWNRLNCDGFNLYPFEGKDVERIMDNATYILWSKDMTYRNCMMKNRNKSIFISHGRTSRIYDCRSYMLSVSSSAKYVVCVSDEEACVVRNYSDNNIIPLVTGFPRHDAILMKLNELDGNTDNKKNQILISFHYRPSIDKSEYDFKRSEYIRKVNEFLNCKQLKDLVSDGNKVVFITHARLKKYANCFSIPNYIEFANDKSHQDVFVESDILITDYSSTMFEFYMMKKPAFIYIPDNNVSYGRYNKNNFALYKCFTICNSEKDLYDKVSSYIHSNRKIELDENIIKYNDTNNSSRLLHKLMDMYGWNVKEEIPVKLFNKKTTNIQNNSVGDIIKVNENSSMWSNKIPIEYGFGKNMFGFH